MDKSVSYDSDASPVVIYARIRIIYDTMTTDHLDYDDTRGTYEPFWTHLLTWFCHLNS